MIIVFSVTGCGQKPNSATVTAHTGSALKNDTETTEDTEEEDTVSTELYIIEGLDMTQETVSLYCVSNSKEYMFNYNLTTQFLDKYGKSTSSSNFTTGTVVTIGDKLPNSGALSEIQMAENVWIFEDLKKYTLDTENNILSIGDSNYKISATTKVYSDGERILLTDITENDVLKVVGTERDILTISVTTGHGYLAISNTDLFNNSLIFIGSKIVSMLNGDCTIEVPEGTYAITVANDGWGGTGEYTVTRNEITEVNLDDLKGEGPKYCDLTFLVTVPDTYVYIDGEQIDTNEVASVRYGSHNLVVTCSGYTSWDKTLVVNSASATITLSLEEDSDSTAETSDDTDTTTTETTDGTATEDTTDTTTTTDDDYDYETDYLSTLSDILGSIID